MNKPLLAAKESLLNLTSFFEANSDIIESQTPIYNRYLQLQILLQAMQQHLEDNKGIERSKVKALVSKVAYETLTEKVVPYVRKIKSSSLLNKLDYTEEDFLEIDDDEFPERISDYTAEIDMILHKLRDLDIDQSDLDLVDLGVETFELVEEQLRNTPEKAKVADANAERYWDQALELIEHVDSLMEKAFETTQKELVKKYKTIRSTAIN